MAERQQPIRVVVCGARGKMGREAIKTVVEDDRFLLVGAIDRTTVAPDVGVFLGIGPTDVPLSTDLDQVLTNQLPDVMVDFTTPEAAYHTVTRAISYGVRPVIGTTGLDAEHLLAWNESLRASDLGGIWAPNFSIGAILQMRFAAQAARYMPHVEIIELHHDQKLDAPSGTALKTIQMIAAERRPQKQGHPQETEKLASVRGGEVEGMRIHSVRLPGYIAHQEVLFGGPGQSLSIRHDVVSREQAYMPGVALAIDGVMSLQGLVQGLEHILD